MSPHFRLRCPPGVMPPKGKGGKGGKGGGGGGGAAGGDAADKKAATPKGGNAVKVRHILCEKHGKVMEAMEEAQIRSEVFSEVATQYSEEDKARQGGDLGWMTRKARWWDHSRRLPSALPVSTMTNPCTPIPPSKTQ
ncbi:unnamed protein product [Staurois parvus]|uniref:Peptidyl-prolyl cis-trans isomerase n=1 Tax=Staurois parvus TaxID=386267 RepID=A0ABN9BSL6_9NEOB|nr:unnamed protein product [Staurois parvus]